MMTPKPNFKSPNFKSPNFKSPNFKSPQFKTVDEYISSQPKPAQAVLSLLRSTILTAVPGVAESISYQMPTYKLHGERVLYFAAWRQHYSLHGATGHLLAALKDDLVRYKVSKGTIQCPLSEPVPVKLIARIAKLRAREATERSKARQ
jgi:uncharacterized protein YdhG (YjbR/CyaY superfamily)